MSSPGWSVDRTQSLGQGSFGQVFAATGPDGERRAAKVVPKTPGASRDLLVVALEASPHIVPVLHVEESADELILFMPRAEESLRDRLSSGKPIPAVEGLDILRQIAEGLLAVGNTVVHRDLKPENILLLDENWALCDFGIARYTGASTAPDTQKFSMTPQYAAPEQWRHEHATSAADVYAFGVIAYEVIGGERPYPGPTTDAYRDQHLNGNPPKIPTTKKLASLMQECLFKAPGARPSVQNLLARLQGAGVDARRPGASALADAHQVLVETRAAEQTARAVEQTENERRKGLAQAAGQLFDQITTELVEAIEDGAPAAEVHRSIDGSVNIALLGARLSITSMLRAPVSSSPFDVITYASIHLDSGQRGSRSHSLYYADFEAPNVYQWYELAFSGSFNADFDREPRALTPAEGLHALSPITGSTQLGRPIMPLGGGDIDEFVDFWSQRFGLAAQGRFQRPSQLPEGNPSYPARR